MHNKLGHRRASSILGFHAVIGADNVMSGWFPPAPAGVMIWVKCGCKRGCKRTCSGRNNNLSFTEVRSCVNFSCHNHANSHDLVMRDMGGDE